MEEKGKVVSREKLMERLWDSDSFVDENTLTVNVNRLRKKPDGVGLTGFIQTKVGTGYMIGVGILFAGIFGLVFWCSTPPSSAGCWGWAC